MNISVNDFADVLQITEEIIMQKWILSISDTFLRMLIKPCDKDIYIVYKCLDTNTLEGVENYR